MMATACVNPDRILNLWAKVGDALIFAVILPTSRARKLRIIAVTEVSTSVKKSTPWWGLNPCV
jgi:hypothetical protein